MSPNTYPRTPAKIHFSELRVTIGRAKSVPPISVNLQSLPKEPVVSMVNLRFVTRAGLGWGAGVHKDSETNEPYLKTELVSEQRKQRQPYGSENN